MRPLRQLYQQESVQVFSLGAAVKLEDVVMTPLEILAQLLAGSQQQVHYRILLMQFSMLVFSVASRLKSAASERRL